MPTFTFITSLLVPDNRLHQCSIEIDAVNVSYSKGYMPGYKSMAITRRSIASETIGIGIFFADVVIESSDGGPKTASEFKKADAQRILELLT